MQTGFVTVSVPDLGPAVLPALERGWRAGPAGPGRVELAHPGSPFPVFLVRGRRESVTTGFLDHSRGQAQLLEIEDDDVADEATGEIPEAKELLALLRRRGA